MPGIHRMQATDVAVDAAKAAPPVVVSALSLFGVSLADWAYTLTIIYTLLLIVQHVWKNWVKPFLSEDPA